MSEIRTYFWEPQRSSAEIFCIQFPGQFTSGQVCLCLLTLTHLLRMWLQITFIPLTFRRLWICHALMQASMNSKAGIVIGILSTSQDTRLLTDKGNVGFPSLFSHYLCFQMRHQHLLTCDAVCVCRLVCVTAHAWQWFWGAERMHLVPVSYVSVHWLKKSTHSATSSCSGLSYVCGCLSAWVSWPLVCSVTVEF